MLVNRPLSTVYRLPFSIYRQLPAYFRSGWAFLIPYLTAYLLYAWLKWPVNPEGLVKVASESVLSVNSQLSALNSQPASILRPPCLLYVYWFLHGLHLVLGAIALRVWWRAPTLSAPDSAIERPNPPQQTAWRSLYAARDRLWPLLPWLCLALLFWIPGVYLEWPSDPWEHLRRINEWRVLDIVTAHSSWMKSSYFIPYSMLSWCMGLRQIYWLDFYYTGICLLLCWQYYRLARACDLGERASMIFVILQALLFGNSIFSFYRYYGISSSIYAQLGAVALTRIVLEALKGPQLSLSCFFTPLPFISPRSVHCSISTHSQSAVHRRPSFISPRTIYRLLLTGIILFTVIAFNHVQGIGIAGLGIAAIVVWRLIDWKKSTIGWLALIAVTSSVAVIFWYPQNPILENSYIPERWLTVWYGFNLFSMNSPSFDRAVTIFGFFGLLNLIAGIILLGRNHVLAWLTLMPAIALSLPIVAIPFSSVLASHSVAEIITYHRLFFAVPSGLALFALSTLFFRRMKQQDCHLGDRNCVQPSNSKYPFLTLSFGLFILGLTPGSQPFFNRVYSAFMRPASDLCMNRTNEILDSIDFTKTGNRQFTLVTPGLAFAIVGQSPECIDWHFTLKNYSISTTIPVLDSIAFMQNRPPAIYVAQNSRSLHTPASISGYLSGHWLPQKVALEHMGEQESATLMQELGCQKVRIGNFTYYFWRF